MDLPLAAPPPARPTAALLAALAAAAILDTGCVYARTHDRAPPPSKEKDLAAHVRSHLDPLDWKTARSAKVLVTYEEPEVNPLGTAESVCVEVVPLWPCARGEWPISAMDHLKGVFQELLLPHLGGGGAAPPRYVLELAFTPRTYLRYTRTVYGLSIFGGVADLLGYPTRYYTAALDLNLALRELDDAQKPGRALVEKRLRAVETSCSGTFLYMIVYNASRRTPFMAEDEHPVSWDDIFAEALVELGGAIRLELRSAFPLRCETCALDHPADTVACEGCGGIIGPPRAAAPDRPKAAPAPAPPPARRR